MSRHSKNNTALSFFTYQEKKRLNYGTQKLRFGKDSLRELDACFLCLQSARNPVCCPEGHIACRECIIENIIAQKKEIADELRITSINSAIKQSEEESKRVKAEQLVVEDFEKSQQSVFQNEGLGKSNGKVNDGKGKGALIKMEEAMEKVEEEDRVAQDSNKSSLPCVWIPSLTPEAKPILKTTPQRTRVRCTATDTFHPLSLKSCVELEFALSDETSKKICPSCTKDLRNGIQASLSRRCGHVMCSKCLQRLLKNEKMCFVCSKRFSKKDAINLQTDGTGFASAGGKIVGQRWNVAFQ